MQKRHTYIRYRSKGRRYAIYEQTIKERMPLSSLLSFSTDFIPPTFTLYIAAFLWCRFGKETDSRQ